jgi:hypothetical protein
LAEIGSRHKTQAGLKEEKEAESVPLPLLISATEEVLAQAAVAG